MVEQKKELVAKKKPPLLVAGGVDFNAIIAKEYPKIINNFMNDKERALKFMSGVTNDISKNPKLAECTPVSLINAYMLMSSAEFMPSAIMGQSYVIPYKCKGVMTANFQISYHGVIDLLGRAGVGGIGAEVIRKNDLYGHEKGQYYHKINMEHSAEDRGDIIGAIAFATFNGTPTTSYINIKDIIKHRDKFSKSHTFSDSPWKTAPESMYKKTVILLLSKHLPKSDKFREVLAEDYKSDSTIKSVDFEKTRLEEAKKLSTNLTMGKNENHDQTEPKKNEEQVIDIT